MQVKPAHFILIGLGGILIGFLGVFNQLWANGGEEALVAPVDSGVAEQASSTPQPAVQAIAQPQRLIITSLELDADVELVGLAKDGRMDIPKLDENVAWYQLGAKPGEIGSAVIAGHYDAKDGGPAVFYELGEVKPGDEVTIVGSGGQSLVFVVTEVAKYKDEDFPLEKVFNQTDTRRLNLITCAGTFNQQQKNYSDRLVVFTQLKTEPPEISI